MGMKMKEIGKLKMYAQGILDCIDELESGAYDGDDDEESDEEDSAVDMVARPVKGDSVMATKGLAMKLGKYK